MAAVIEKDLRVIMRSIPLLYALGGPMIMVLILGGLFRGGGHVARHPFPLALPLCMAYALVGFTQLIFNNLGTEGTGIQLLFLSPTPIRSVLLAKNLLHSVLFALIALGSGVMASLRIGSPGVDMVAATVAWVLFALPVNLGVGNILSLTMPYRVNLSRISRQRGSQASSLFSLLVQAAVLGVGMGVIWACMVVGRLWLATPILLALSAIGVLAWYRILSNVDAMANQRRDTLIEVLVKTE